jgi:hypothetical protein
VPNQEKVINRIICVTYHDKARYMRMILLPIRELMQAHSALVVVNSLCSLAKQEWESKELQNGTVLESRCWEGPSGELLIALTRLFVTGFLLGPP